MEVEVELEVEVVVVVVLVVGEEKDSSGRSEGIYIAAGSDC